MPRKKITEQEMMEHLLTLKLTYGWPAGASKQDDLRKLGKIWHKAFQDKTNEQLGDAIAEYIKNTPYHSFPVPGEVNQYIKSVSHFTEKELMAFQEEDEKLTEEDLKQLKESPIFKQLQEREKTEDKEKLSVEEIDRRIEIIKKELNKKLSDKKTTELLQMMRKLEKERWEALDNG